MRLITTLTACTVLLFGTVGARTPDYFAIYEVLGVEYTVGSSPTVEGIGETLGVYNPNTDSISMQFKRQKESQTEYFHTLLHELAHWTGFTEERANRWPHLDTFQEECVAEFVAIKLSKVLYNGKYEYNPKFSDRYLSCHPMARELSEHEINEVVYCSQVAYEFLIKEIKRLDKENELGL